MNFDTNFPNRLQKPAHSPTVTQIKLPLDILNTLGIQQHYNNQLPLVNMTAAKLNSQNSKHKKINHNQMPDIMINPQTFLKNSQISPNMSSRTNHLMSQPIHSSSNRPSINFSYSSSMNRGNQVPLTANMTFNPSLNQVRFSSVDQSQKKYMNVIQHSTRNVNSQLSKFSKQSTNHSNPQNSLNIQRSALNPQSIPERFHKQSVIKLGKKSIINNNQNYKFKQRQTKNISNYATSYEHNQNDFRQYNKQNLSKLQIQKSEYIPLQKNNSEQYLEDIIPETLNQFGKYKLNIRQNEKSYEQRVKSEEVLDTKENKFDTNQMLQNNQIDQLNYINMMPMPQIQEEEFDDLKISNLSKRLQKISNRAYLSQEGSQSQLKSIYKKNNLKQSTKINNYLQNQSQRKSQVQMKGNDEETPYKQMKMQSRVNDFNAEEVVSLKQKLKEKEIENSVLRQKMQNMQIQTKIASKEDELKMMVKINEIQIKKLSNFLRMYKIKEKQFQIKQKKYQLNINQLQKMLALQFNKF